MKFTAICRKVEIARDMLDRVLRFLPELMNEDFDKPEDYEVDISEMQNYQVWLPVGTISEDQFTSSVFDLVSGPMYCTVTTEEIEPPFGDDPDGPKQTADVLRVEATESDIKIVKGFLCGMKLAEKTVDKSASGI
jgi:hypothetical protein